MSDEANVMYLQAFAADEALTQLEKAQSEFNIFQAIGAANRELWHSDFLAFLLDPKQNHSLGDEFAKRLLTHVCPELSGIGSFGDITVRREHQDIDILVEDEQQQLCVIIENKIWSTEIPGQLARYWNTVVGEHPGPNWRILGIFLTPHGLPPIETVDRERYKALSYSAVAETLNEVREEKIDQIGKDVELTLRHYVEMVRRFVVGNVDAAALARELYFKHLSAIRLMDPAIWKGWIKGHMDHLIKESPALQPEVGTREYMRFRVGEWDKVERLREGTDKTTSYPTFFFTCQNFDDSLTLYLWVGPSASAEVRKALLDLAEQNSPPFCKPVVMGQWHYIYELKILTKNDYITCSDAELKVLIEAK
ncbi:MAG: PD-(D/E)XK nuclease family protein [Chloroflexota bacterium]